MRISSKGRYGLKAVVDIAYNLSISKRFVSIKSIAERQGMSENYLEHIIAPLKKAGILRSMRGAGGGYYLAKSPCDLTAGEVLRVLEGPLAPVDCVVDGINVCGDADCNLCVMKPALISLFEEANKLVDSISIQSLVDDYVRLSKIRGDEKGASDGTKNLLG